MLILREFTSYLIAVFVVFQSFVTIADVHDVSNEWSHDVMHEQFSDQVQQLTTQQSVNADTASSELNNHPDCHQHHCHHSNIVYADVKPLPLLVKLSAGQLANSLLAWRTWQISPDLRPPIV